MNFIKRMLLKGLIKNPVPERIPRTSPKSKNVNCSLVYLRSKDNSWTFLVRKISDNYVEGKYWHGDFESQELSIPYSSLDNYLVDITHFYGQYDLQYDSFTQYFFEGIIPFDKLKIFFGRADQFLFNKKELIRFERMDVLKLLTEKTIDEKKFKVTPHSLLSLLHTKKWFYHPDQERQRRYASLILESLKSSGDLVLDNGMYLLSGNALTTLSEYEAETKRHDDIVTQSRAMKWLTLILIIASFIQAGIMFYTSNENTHNKFKNENAASGSDASTTRPF